MALMISVVRLHPASCESRNPRDLGFLAVPALALLAPRSQEALLFMVPLDSY